MSVRRLADDAIQPESFAFTEENLAWARSRMAVFPEGRQQSAVIPILMRAQQQAGWVSRAMIEYVADLIGMPRIRVLEIATFYTQFQLQPVGARAHVQVCGTTPCMLRGAEDLRHVCQKKIHAEPHHTNADGTLSWEEVECLGACVNAPMVMIGEDTYEDLTPERLEEIIDAFERGEGASIRPGPQIDRQFSAPVTGPTALKDVAFAVTGRAAEAAAGKPGEEGPHEYESSGKPMAAGARRVRGYGVDRRSDIEAESGEPVFLRPDGDPDDLKLIAGVGPVLEKRLNSLGVTQFAQIAAFTETDIETLDRLLKFKGRIAREDWIKQASTLARGGIEEYRRVFGKDPR